MRRRGRSGFTLIEMMIALALALIVVFALGRIVLANQRAWEWGRDKTVLQANVTEALEWMSRMVHGSRTLKVVAHSPVDYELITKDETGAVIHTYRRVMVSGVGRLQQDGSNFVDRPCTRFIVTPNSDTTSVTLDLELQSNSGSLVAATTRATVRNRFFTF